MTKNLSLKPGYRGGNPKADKKLQPNSNATNHHSQNETVVANSTAVLITVQKASIDLKMLTPEQRRLANLMNDKVDVTEIEKKINKIMELTGASKDKAIVALHDCANELDKAIDMILEGDSINESEWKSQARKKKPKASKEEQNANSGKILNGDAKKGGQKAGGRQIRSKQQQTNNSTSDKQNKFERAGNKRDRDQQPHWKQSKEPNNSVNDESTTQLEKNKDVEQVDDKLDDWPDESPSTNNNNTSNSSSTQRNRVVNNNNNESQFKPSTHKYHQDRDQRRPPTGSRSNYNNRNFGTSGDRNLSDRRNDRGQGDRMMDRRPYQNKSYTKKPGNFTNSIDTWSNYTVTDNNPTTNNDYAQMTVGNWSDVVSSTSTTANVQQNKNEDLNENNEWTEPSTTTNLVDQLKNNNQTANKPDHHNLPKMPNLASIVSGVKPQPPQQPVQQQTVHHKSPNVKQQQPQQSINLSNSNNHQLSASQQHPLTKSPQQQRQPPQQTSSSTTNQPNKIDLAALLKSSSTNQPPQPQQPQSTNEQQMNKLIRGNIQQQQQRSSNSDTNTYGAALLQRLQQGANNLSDYVNSYSTSNSQQLSSQNKNLVHHIPSTSNYNSQNNPTSALFDNQSHHNQLQHQQQTTSLEHQKSLIEKKRRQTKIPETAVEMPSSDHISSLNVQFGALDFVGSATNTAADSYLNDHQSSNNEKSANSSTPANSLLSTVRSNDNKQNISDHHQQLQDNILHAAADNRNKQQVQQQTGYQQHINNSYKNENTSSIYPSNLQGYQSSYSVNNYGSQNHQQQNNQSMSSSNQQKINLKDLDTSSSTANSDKQNPANNANSNSLGNLVNNSTVTTNVLKNSLTATGKTQANMQQQLNVPPNVAPLLGTPQYIMSQPGLSTAFYPVYDMPMAPATDHSFRGYNQNTGPQDVKYTRSDNQDGQTNHPVNPGVGQSNQAPVTQTPNHQIFSHIPPYFFYTGMMTQGLQGLYQTPAPIFPVQPNPGPPNAGNPQAPHANSNHSTAGFGGPKSAQNQAAPYSTASAYSTSTSYDPMTGQLTNQGAQDYNKPQNYTSGPNNSNQQTVKQMSNTGSNDLVNNNMYTKSHAQLTKNFDKSGTFQSGTPPPPFGIAALGYNPNQFIPMMQPQSNPSMLHHSLQGDGSNHNQNNSGVGGNNQRGSLSQKNTTSNANKYYNWS